MSDNNDGRNLDLNLLRTFAVVAESGSVTKAAARLYLTQPAVSAALHRLTEQVGEKLFVRQGRRLALTERGRTLSAHVHSHLSALIDAVFSTPQFEPSQDESVLRIGFSDATEMWLLPKLLRVLERVAPRLRVISLPVQFRNVAEMLVSGNVQMAITVADDLPTAIRREPLLQGDFVCLFDPRRVSFSQPPTESEYFAREHLIVTYNGDLRGIVEDLGRKRRKIRCSVANFANVGAIIEGSTLVATVPRLVADSIRVLRPRLACATLPIRLPSGTLELLFASSTEADRACRFVRSEISRIAAEVASATSDCAARSTSSRSVRGDDKSALRKRRVT